MNITAAIATLNKFKQVAKKVSGECELLGFGDNSFTMKITFGNDNQKKKIIGFSQTDE